MSETSAWAVRERPARERAAWPGRSRWLVHLGLLGTAAAALGTLQLLHVRIAYHADVGLVFAGLVLVHLAQRRKTLARSVVQLARAGRFAGAGARRTVSDVVLFLVASNVLVSGVLDWGRGAPTQVPLPKPLDRWHLDAALALVVYLAVHVRHRRKRLRRSAIR